MWILDYELYGVICIHAALWICSYSRGKLMAILVNDAYILVRGDITIIAAGAKQVAFRNCALFTKYITKIDGTKIDEA